MYEVILCTKCGEPINEEEIYCTNCGNKNDKYVRCPNCQRIMVEKNYMYECPECRTIKSKSF
jgi:exosome complex RNA-binding protein Csl4